MASTTSSNSVLYTPRRGWCRPSLRTVVVEETPPEPRWGLILYGPNRIAGDWPKPLKYWYIFFYFGVLGRGSWRCAYEICQIEQLFYSGSTQYAFIRDKHLMVYAISGETLYVLYFLYSGRLVAVNLVGSYTLAVKGVCVCVLSQSTVGSYVQYLSDLLHGGWPSRPL